MDDKITTYQIGRATVHIHGDREKLDMEQVKTAFAHFMTQVYQDREEQEAAQEDETGHAGI